MEYFYRELRREYKILMNEDGTPVGGKWNYDAENRVSPDPTKNTYLTLPKLSLTQ